MYTRNVTRLEFQHPSPKPPVRMWTCLNRLCMHRWPNLVVTPARTITWKLDSGVR